MGSTVQHGAIIIFDNNYRSALWQSKEQARTCYDEIYPFVDIALPSFDDAKHLYGDKSLDETAARLRAIGVREVVVKASSSGYLLVDDETHEFIQVEPAKNVVDTSGAGDSFNGAYLAKRLCGALMKDASKYAASIASKVVQHRGAIILSVEQNYF